MTNRTIVEKIETLQKISNCLYYGFVNGRKYESLAQMLHLIIYLKDKKHFLIKTCLVWEYAVCQIKVKISFLIHLWTIDFEQSSISIKQSAIDYDKGHHNETIYLLNATTLKARETIVFVASCTIVGETKLNSMNPAIKI